MDSNALLLEGKKKMVLKGSKSRVIHSSIRHSK